MPDYGIKVGLVDIDTDTDAVLPLTSKFSTLKLYQWANATLTTNGSGNGSVTIPHNLNYRPAFLVFRKEDAQWTDLDAATYSNAFFPVGGANFYVKNDDLHHAVYAYSDENNLYIKVEGGTPSKTMNFRWYILVDKSAVFAGISNVSNTGDYGMKAAKTGGNVLTDEEHELQFSSKYKSLQYYPGYQMSKQITLPEMFASFVDTFVEEATYVDFVHNLGYPPVFFAHFLGSAGATFEIPYTQDNSIDAFDFSIAGFADATKVRIYFWRSSTFFTSLLDPWSAETITIKCSIFTENLLGAAYP